MTQYPNSCYATSLSPKMRLDLYEKLVKFYESAQKAYPHRPKNALGAAQRNLKRAEKEFKK